MNRLDIKADTRRIFEVLQKGGIAIIPNDAGYALMGGSKEAVQRIFDAKRRGSHKRNAMLCSRETQRELHGRIGSCYELITDVLKRHFDVELPEDPGREVNASGHLQEFAFAEY